MSFKPKTPAPDNKLGNISEEFVSTNQEAVPVPYLAGRYPMRVTWITDALGVQVKDVQAQTGKKSTSTVAREYYANIAGALCLGVLDYITSIIIDSNEVWSGLLTRDGSGTGAIYKTVTIEGYGTAKIYWGTADQEPDPLLTTSVPNPEYVYEYDPETGSFGDNGESPTLPGASQPAFRFVAYIVFQQLLFGRDRTSAPQVEVIGGRVPSEYSTGETAEGVNPLSITYELLTSKLYGFGKPSSVIDATTWGATRDAIDPDNEANANKPSRHISVYLTRQQPIRSIMSDLTSYYDGFFRVVDGKIEAGYFPHEAPSSEEGLLILDPSDFTDEPDIESVGWSDTFNIFQLVHVDRDRKFKEVGNPYISKHNIVITKENRPTNVNRPWITTVENGAKWISEYGKLESFPYIQGSLSCRKIRTNGLREGDLFRLNYEPYSINQLCRCLSVSEPNPGSLTRKVEFMSERGVMPDPYAPAADDTPPIPRLPATPVAFAKVIELPLEFYESVYTYVGIIPIRQTLATLGWRGFYTLDDPGASTPDYDEVANHLFFGAIGRLDVAYADSGESDMTVTMTGVDAATLQSMTDKQRDDDTLLLVIDNEIFTVGTVTPLGGGQFTVSVKRARRGSSAAAHVQYSLCYIIERQKMKTLTNENFLEQTPGWFKIIGYTGREEADTGPIVRVDFRDRIGSPPTVVFGSLPSSPVTGKTYSITGTISDVDADLAKYQVTAAKIVSDEVDSELTMLIGDITEEDDPSEFAFKIPFMFPSVGVWRIIVRAYDSQGGFVKEESDDVTVTLGNFAPDDGITPDPVTDVTITPGLTMLVLEWTNPTNTTVGVIRIYESTTTTRPPQPSILLQGDWTFHFRQNLASSATRYYWFEVQGLNGRLSTIVGPYSNTTRAGIDLSDVIPGMTLVEIVDSLPASGNFDGRTVVLTTDKKLYRYDGDTSSYTASVETVDLDGQITQTQITDGAISTAKLAALAITAEKIASNAITTDKLAANAVTAGTIAAGAITASAVGTNQIIANAANIADAVITSAKIASVVADKITAGNLVSMYLKTGKIATDFLICNDADQSRTMPVASYAVDQADNGGSGWNSLGTGGIEIWMHTFSGWTSGSPGNSNTRFGKSTTLFRCDVNGGGVPAFGDHLAVEIIYRVNGGSTVQVNAFQTRTPNGNGSFSLSAAVELIGLAGSDSVEFGVRAKTVTNNASTKLDVFQLGVHANNI